MIEGIDCVHMEKRHFVIFLWRQEKGRFVLSSGLSAQAQVKPFPAVQS